MPTDSIRAALERLISAYDEHGGRWTQHDEDALHDAVERARADLAAEPERGPSDEQDQCWQWYAYDPEEGIEMYPDREQARSAAQSIMGTYQEAAHSDGWHEDMKSVSWGMLVPFECAQIVARRSAEDSKWDEWVQYELRTARESLPGALPVAIQTMTTTDPKQIMTRPIRAALTAADPDPAAGGEALLAGAPNEEPSDEEIRQCRSVVELAHVIQGAFPLASLDAERIARAVLARRGRPAAPAAPADGEVGQLVAWLNVEADLRRNDLSTPTGLNLAQAARQAGRLQSWATLLQQQAAELASLRAGVVLVAVSERLPGPEDCDEKGRCWFFDPCDDGWWCFRSALFIDGDPAPFTHWRPAHALPLPAPQAGEVE